MEHTANQIVLRGYLDQLPRFSHENHGKRFYGFSLEVPRLSGAVDLLPVIARDTVLNQMDLSGGEMIALRGQVRSFRNPEPSGQRLRIYAFAEELRTEDGEPCNEVTLCGMIGTRPVFRRTPLGREICDVMLVTPRSYGRADRLPCIFWGRTGMEIAQGEVGDQVTLTGRLQSRGYKKMTENGVEERTAYEISALTAQLQKPQQQVEDRT